jgi:predicted RNA-binding protein Jag
MIERRNGDRDYRGIIKRHEGKIIGISFTVIGSLATIATAYLTIRSATNKLIADSEVIVAVNKKNADQDNRDEKIESCQNALDGRLTKVEMFVENSQKSLNMVQENNNYLKEILRQMKDRR